MTKTQDSKRKRVTTKALKKNKNKNENMRKTRSTRPSLRELVASPSFPRSMNDLEKCWNTQKEVFLSGRRCHEINGYHDNMDGCGSIDASIEKHFGSSYKKKLFNYYSLVGDLSSTRSLLKRLITDDDIPGVGRFALLRKDRDQLREEGISLPHGYEDKFPEFLNPSHIFGNTKRVLLQGKMWISNCVMDRINFRDICVKDCNKKLLDKEHQDFIIKLQVLYARTEMAYRRVHRVG